jgi:transposase
MQTITSDAVVVGVDTHKDVHVAVALSGLGARLGNASAPATEDGYRSLADWARGHGAVYAFGVEGTGSYGAGLSRALATQGFRVIEVNRPNRQLRRQRGKSDAVDAEAAARAVLAGQADAPPKSGDGEVEMIRHLKIARDTALKSRTQAMVTLKTLLVNAPQPLREQFIAVTGRMTLIRGLAALRPGVLISTTASAKTALRALARRWLALDGEIGEHDAVLEVLVRKRAPALMAAPGISTGTVAEILVALGDNPERIRSEAAFAKLCGVCPIPASSGKTNRHRLNRGGNRRANAALYRVAVVRMRSHALTRAYVQRRTAEGKSLREIRRCLKRYIAREIFGHLCAEHPRSVSTSEAS